MANLKQLEQTYRHRVEGLRAVAALAPCERTRCVLLRIASKYDRLAQLADKYDRIAQAPPDDILLAYRQSLN